MAIGVKSIITKNGDLHLLGNAPIGFYDTDRQIFSSYDGVIRIPRAEVRTVHLWDDNYIIAWDFNDEFINEFDGYGL